MRHFSLLMPLLAFAAVGCGRGNPFIPDRMTGCYATEALKAAELRINKDSGQYRLSIRQRGQWDTEDTPLRTATASELHSLVGADTALIIENLVLPGAGFGLLRVRQGAVILGETAKSNYFAFLLFGGSAVFKVPCP